MNDAPRYLPDWQSIGRKFVEHYYSTFAQNRESVLPLYHPTAMLTFEDNEVQGHDAIKTILTTKLSFDSIVHQITKVDLQPTQDMGVLVLVTGRLKTDEDPPHAFSQTFYIKYVNDSYFIMHDIFRLSLHDTL